MDTVRLSPSQELGIVPVGEGRGKLGRACMVWVTFHGYGEIPRQRKCEALRGSRRDKAPPIMAALSQQREEVV